MITKQQTQYLSLYEAGYSVTEIAQMTGKNKSTISRVLTLARNRKCPFSADCGTCPLDDCAISDEYAYMLNGIDNGRNSRLFKDEEDA